MEVDHPLRVVGKIQHPCPELLLRVAIFDAYAVAVENVKEEAPRLVLAKLDPDLGYQQNLLHPELKASCYTDDTERAIGNARVLLEASDYISQATFASVYHDEFVRSGRHKGYARGFQALLESVANGKELLEKLRNNSCRNGAMMGAGVLGVLPTIDEVLHVAAVQASVTHNTSCGIFSARVAALATHYALYSHDPIMEVAAFLRGHQEKLCAPFDGEFDCGHRPLRAGTLANRWPDDRLVFGSDELPIGLATVQASLTIVAEQKSLREALATCLKIGGDTDSVAAVIASIMAPRYRGEVLPAFLDRDLEFCSSWTGASRLLELGGALMRRYS